MIALWLLYSGVFVLQWEGTVVHVTGHTSCVIIDLKYVVDHNIIMCTVLRGNYIIQQVVISLFLGTHLHACTCIVLP